MHSFGRSLSLALILCLLCGSMPVHAEELYIIADSSTRKLTSSELWQYQYDTLKYAFNEIFARHGYKFETGSACYNWFTLMPWYKPNSNENSQNHNASLNACSQLEWDNVNLIKQVRSQMRAMGTTNPNGKGLPTPPNPGADRPRGFEYVSLKGGQKLAVYSAPSYTAYRANNGKASCSTNGAVYALGWDGGWMLMLYEANNAGQFRVGYVNGSEISGTLPALGMLAWERETREVLQGANLTDDPALTGNSMAWIPAGTSVTYLTTMYNSQAWAYVETVINGQTARGFLPDYVLSMSQESDG